MEIASAAPRQRRTVPLTSSVHRGKYEQSMASFDDTSYGSSLQSEGLSLSTLEVSLPSQHLDPRKKSFSTRPANDGTKRISTAELKRSMIEKQKNRSNQNRSGGGGSRSSIGSALMKSDSNLISVEQAFQDSLINSEDGSSSWTERPIKLPTPFDLDSSRGDSQRQQSIRKLKLPTRTVSAVSNAGSSNPIFSEEQDAWAGIDELLEGKSLEDSFSFSTCDILPRETVQAMRRVSKYDEETVCEESMSVVEESVRFRRTLSPMIKNQDSLTSREERQKARGDADLFNVFQWSERDNIDEQRRRKGKLNSNPRKMKLLDVKRKNSISNSDNSSLPSLATFRPDDFSVMSSASTVDWSTHHSKMGGRSQHTNRRSSMTSSDVSGDGFGLPSIFEDNAQGTVTEGSTDDASTAEDPPRSQSSFARDGLVLDKGVEEYITKIQQNLTSKSEHASGKKVSRKKHVGFHLEEDEDTSSSPTTVVPEDNTLEDLPSLTAFSSRRLEQAPSRVERKGRKEEKKEPKPSLAYLMSSLKNPLKKISLKGRGQQKLGDEEKYFPDAVRQSGNNARKFGANRCLLNQGEDGVNWDAD